MLWPCQVQSLGFRQLSIQPLEPQLMFAYAHMPQVYSHVISLHRVRQEDISCIVLISVFKSQHPTPRPFNYATLALVTFINVQACSPQILHRCVGRMRVSFSFMRIFEPSPGTVFTFQKPSNPSFSGNLRAYPKFTAPHEPPATTG